MARIAVERVRLLSIFSAVDFASFIVLRRRYLISGANVSVSTALASQENFFSISGHDYDAIVLFVNTQPDTTVLLAIRF